MKTVTVAGRVVNKVPAPPPINRPARTVSYPWDLWLDGRIWEINKSDVPCSLERFRSTAYMAASERQIGVSVLVRGSKYYLQAKKSG